VQIKTDFLKQRVDRPLPKAPEPARPKTHWDYLLEEMAWLAKDMEKERRWKAKQAKRFVFAVVRGRHDLESRGLRQVRINVPASVNMKIYEERLFQKNMLGSNTR